MQKSPPAPAKLAGIESTVEYSIAVPQSRIFLALKTHFEVSIFDPSPRSVTRVVTTGCEVDEMDESADTICELIRLTTCIYKEFT